jgi:hypothetical protein
MKFIIAYYLLLLYGVVICKPLIPIATDLLSHTFAEAIHLATVHAKYGNDHLEKEMANTGAENNKNQTAVKSEEIFITHISVKNYAYHINIKKLSKYYPNLKQGKIESIFILTPAPPPKFS